MADRKGQQTRQAQTRASARGKAGASTRAPAIVETPDQIRRERDRLRRELEAAQAEIARLKARHEEAVNRIDWAIDSLNSLRNGET